MLKWYLFNKVSLRGLYSVRNQDNDINTSVLSFLVIFMNTFTFLVVVLLIAKRSQILILDIPFFLFGALLALVSSIIFFSIIEIKLKSLSSKDKFSLYRIAFSRKMSSFGALFYLITSILLFILSAILLLMGT